MDESPEQPGQPQGLPDQDGVEAERALAHRWRRQPVEEPSSVFADRVVAAWLRESLPRAQGRPDAPTNVLRKWWRRWARPQIAVAAGLAVLVLAVTGRYLLRPLAPPDAGPGRVAGVRETVTLGDRGVGVLEPGAEIRGAGQRWHQARGDVFYRIDRGGPFEIETPAGQVTVLGTCFRVEVNPMGFFNRQSTGGFGAGAVVTAAVLVTVYEGRVRLANGEGSVELGPGDRGLASPGAGPSRHEQPTPRTAPERPRPPVFVPPPGSDGATEVERLRAKVAEQERDLHLLRNAAEKVQEAEGRFVDPTKEELLARAARCEVRFDYPHLLDQKTSPLNDEAARKLGMSETQRLAVDEVMTELHAENWATLKALYLEMTRDAAGAERLLPKTLYEEILRSASDLDSLKQRMAREAAGLVARPTDLSSSPAAERAFRHMASLGDLTERRLAEVLGPDLAHKLRAARNGWSNKSRYSGCPKPGVGEGR